jgi:hypothetical protein
MSGGVGPTAGGGITLPSMGAPPPPLHPTPTSPTPRPHHHYYLFSIKQLNTLGAAAVLAFSTTVPLSEIAFAVLLLPYLLVLARLAFPQRPGKPNPGTRPASQPRPRTRSSSPRRCSPRASRRRGPARSRSPSGPPCP